MVNASAGKKLPEDVKGLDSCVVCALGPAFPHMDDWSEVTAWTKEQQEASSQDAAPAEDGDAASNARVQIVLDPSDPEQKRVHTPSRVASGMKFFGKEKWDKSLAGQKDDVPMAILKRRNAEDVKWAMRQRFLGVGKYRF